MLSNLRKASGFEYTSKLQRMFVDKALSRELHTGYMQVLVFELVQESVYCLLK